jgi:hypothetical protein
MIFGTHINPHRPFAHFLCVTPNYLSVWCVQPKIYYHYCTSKHQRLKVKNLCAETMTPNFFVVDFVFGFFFSNLEKVYWKWKGEKRK